MTQVDYYRGVPMVRYDLLEEVAVVTVAMLVLVPGPGGDLLFACRALGDGQVLGAG